MNPSCASRLLLALAVVVAAMFAAGLTAADTAETVAPPLLHGQRILYVVRHQYASDHHGTETMFQNGEIATRKFRGPGALKILAVDESGRTSTQTLCEALAGVIRDPEISFDGARVVFSMRRDQQDDYHLYEMSLAGGEPRQLTAGSELADTDPAYLPDGRIVFSSTRDVKYCQCNRHICPNLFVLDLPGTLTQIGRNNLAEIHASAMPDGRILYSRWEYVDRQFGPSFGLWTCNPDGTNHALFYGNNAWSPGAIYDARVIPGSERVVCTFGACHDRPWGAIAIVDRRRGMDGSEPVVRVWPESARRLLEGIDNFAMEERGKIDLFSRVRPKYEDPYPLCDPESGAAGEYFLVSRQIDAGAEKMGIYLIDVAGNETLIHAEDGDLGCYDPIPIAARRTPPVIPDRTDPDRDVGYFYVHDVYQGSGMKAVKRGTIKHVRVVQAPPKRAWTHTAYGIDATQAPAMNWNLTTNKRILGDASVADDGSAYFAVPADKFVYFQLLNANKMMVQSMRSGTTLMSGETAGCAGCHEDRGAAPPLAPEKLTRRALLRVPEELTPWYGPERDFNYLTEVQPVFDAHCVRCHDYGQAAGEVLNLAGDLGLVFNTSYVELHARSAIRWTPDQPRGARRLISAIHDGPPGVLPAYAWGSHRSKLIDVMRGEHYDVKLSEEDLARVVTWIDLNAPYYGSYFAVYRDHPFGRSPISDEQLGELCRLAGRGGVRAKGDHAREELNLISFSRPELSPILASVPDKNGDAYRQTLAMIQSGQSTLAKQPREDMLGPAAAPVCKDDRQRMARKQRLRTD